MAKIQPANSHKDEISDVILLIISWKMDVKSYLARFFPEPLLPQHSVAPIQAVS